MQFASPLLLYALAALAIPVLLHLFYFRRFRKVEFSNVRFLAEVKEETQNRSRLRNLVVLALRLLAFAALVLAFAQPFFGGDSASAKPETTRVGIFVDNSYSMSAQASDVALLDKAKQRAREVIQSYGETAQFQVATNELAGSSSRLVSQEDALGLVDQVALSSRSREVGAVVSRFAKLADGGGGGAEARAPVFLISDFQATQFEGGLAALDTLLDVKLVPLAAVEQRNVSVDSVWLASPVQLVGEPVTLLVALTNHGAEDADAVRVSARTRSSTQPFGTKEVPAYTTVVDTLTLSAQRAGWTDVTVAITDYPIEFDDRYHLSFEIQERLRVLAISEGAPRPNLRAAFPPNGPLAFEAERASNVGYSGLADYDLVVLDGLTAVSSGLTQALASYTAAGGKVLVFPKGGGDRASYDRLLGQLGMGSFGAYQAGEFAVGSVNTRSFVFSDVFERLPRNVGLPSVRGRYQGVARFGESLLDYRDGRPYLVAQRQGAGVAYVATAGLDAAESDLVRNGEIFVPMLYRMALSGASARPAAYTLGRDEIASYPAPRNAGDEALRLRGDDGVTIPSQRALGSQVVLSFGQSPTAAGFYRLEGIGDTTLAHLAFNYDRRESPQRFLGEDALAATALDVYDGNASGSLGAALATAARGSQWWPQLLVLALLALLAEALVLRFWEPNRVRARPAVARA